MSLSFVTTPSVGPLLQGNKMAAVKAFCSRSSGKREGSEVVEAAFTYRFEPSRELLRLFIPK